MGNGGIYGKRKKQERPSSPRERSASAGATSTAESSSYEVDRYIRKGSKQKGIDSSLVTTGRRKWEQKRGRGKKGE